MRNFSAVVDLAALFAGRIGGIVVTLIFIPQYASLLGGTLFGAVSVILSLQTFFLMSDLGLATLIGRDTAIAQGNATAMTAAIWLRRRAEMLLAVIVVVAGASILLAAMLGGSTVPRLKGVAFDLVVIIALIATLVAINIDQLGLNALGRYRASAATAVIGGVVRGGVTLVVLMRSPTLSAFLIAQLTLAVLHFAVVRQLVERSSGVVLWQERLFDRSALKGMLHRCVPLTLYTLASAAAVNMDKPIISAFVSLKSAGVYFLSTTYALVPVAVLSGPLNGYFAPKVAHAVSSGDLAAENRLAAIFQIVLMIAVIGPSLSLWLEMGQWMPLWLHHSPAIEAVMQIAPILLVAGGLSATGYYPTTYLIAVGDNGYLARLSLVCGVTVLILAVFFASHGQLQAVAWSYFGFYTAGLFALWARIIMIKGWQATVVFLTRNYFGPLAAILAGYFAGAYAVIGRSDSIANLIIPILFSMTFGALVLVLYFMPILRSFIPSKD